MEKEKASKKSVPNAVIIATFLIGFLIVLSPVLLEFRNRRTRVEEEEVPYTAALEEASEEELDRVWEEACAYNARHTVNLVRDSFEGLAAAIEKPALSSTASESVPPSDDLPPYEALLNPAGNGTMGFLDIPKISVSLPVKHGLSAEVLERNVGHMEGTSLPVGGDSSHCVLAAHRGLADALLFTDLDKLEIGDRFYLRVQGNRLAYEVDEIRTVLPEELDALAIVPGEDLVTLVTCTPFAINTKRLLVRGTRVDETEAEEPALVSMTEQIKAASLPWKLAAVFCLIFVFLMGLLLIRSGKRKNGSSPD